MRGVSLLIRPAGRRRGGFSLVEVLLVALLLALAIGPLISAFAPAVTSSAEAAKETVLATRARGTLNRVASLSYTSLLAQAGSAVSLPALFGSSVAATQETFSAGGIFYTPTVAISNAGGTTGGLLRIAVTIDRVTMETLRADY